MKGLRLMICNDCRHAATLNEKGLQYVLEGRDKDAAVVFSRSEAMHTACEDGKPGCYCQHTTRRADLHRA